MWFSKNDLIKHNSIIIDDLHGYVLPHAGTKHSGSIISHTLRYKPKKFFNKVIILYYPSQEKPNVNDKYYHEFFVPWKSIDFFIVNQWKLNHDIDILGINLQNLSINLSYFDLDESIIIVSADFSHFLEMNKAIELENKASHSIQHRQLIDTEYNRIIDDKLTFEQLYRIIPDSFILQWIGRTRSEGEKGVGYLSFLIRDRADPIKKFPDGFFVTAYDKNMTARECLGDWFTDKKWTQKIEDELVKKVIHLGKTTSRLTGGMNKNIPITNYTITYLYKDKGDFIRGWHGVKYHSFFLPDVFLENTYDNGDWINFNDKEWPQKNNFNMTPTIKKLEQKSGNIKKTKYDLYYSSVNHFNI